MPCNTRGRTGRSGTFLKNCDHEKKEQQSELTGEAERKERGQHSELHSAQYLVLQHLDTSVDLLCMKAFNRIKTFL